MLEPKKRRLSSIGILGDFEVVGSVYILTKEAYVTELRDKINSSIQKFTNIAGGATIMPYRCGVLVRMLGHVAGDLRNAIHEVVAITRRLILNASFSGIRKG
jgi:urease accessory protein